MQKSKVAAKGGKIQNYNPKLKTSCKTRYQLFDFWILNFDCVRRARAGFTLIELLIYIALVGVIAVATTNTVITLNRTIAVFRIERRLTTSAELAIRRMVREIRLANSVYASSTLAVSPGVLSVASVESETDATPKDVLLRVDSGALTVRRGSADALVFTGSAVTVSRLVFWKMDNADVSQAVKIEMTLTTTSGGVTRSKDYFMTTLLRGAY